MDVKAILSGAQNGQRLDAQTYREIIKAIPSFASFHLIDDEFIALAVFETEGKWKAVYLAEWTNDGGKVHFVTESEQKYEAVASLLYSEQFACDYERP